MSLGPFELMGAAPSNPHGHFESVPFWRLNQEVQRLAFGFGDDLPDSADTLARFLELRGNWSDSVTIPDSLITEGRSLVRALLYSGRIAGFKDPRTVLNWPFWERVLAGFPGIRVVTAGLIRSPHEIAMSLVTRQNGLVGYWSALDVVAIHLLRMKQVLEARSNRPGSVCFGHPSYLTALQDLVRQCGLTWDDDVVNEVFDQSCVHHVPATIVHESQEIFESLLDQPLAADSLTNQALLARDSRALEDLRFREWQTNRERIVALEAAETRTREIERLLQTAQVRLADSQRMFEQTSEAVNAMQAKLIASQEREIRAWEHNEHLRDRLERYESHPIIGVALRSRRRLRGLVESVRHGLSSGQDAPALGTGGVSRS
jgi:hypothetical protein